MLRNLCNKNKDILQKIDICEEVYRVGKSALSDDNLNLNIVNQNVNGVSFKCFLGHVIENIEGISGFDDAQSKMGISQKQTLILFGHSSNDFTINERLDYLKAHINGLYKDLVN